MYYICLVNTYIKKGYEGVETKRFLATTLWTNRSKDVVRSGVGYWKTNLKVNKITIRRNYSYKANAKYSRKIESLIYSNCQRRETIDFERKSSFDFFLEKEFKIKSKNSLSLYGFQEKKNGTREATPSLIILLGK